MTEYIASSPDVGRRPRISLIFSYSSGLSPSAAYGCSFSGVAMALETVSATEVAGMLTGKGLLDRGMPDASILSGRTDAVWQPSFSVVAAGRADHEKRRKDGDERDDEDRGEQHRVGQEPAQQTVDPRLV